MHSHRDDGNEGNAPAYTPYRLVLQVIEVF